MARRDLYQEVTDRIIEALEAGTAPWIKPWKVDGKAVDFGMPRNGASQRAYSGVNVLLCHLSAMTAGYTSQEWFTFNQAKKLGAHVRKGEKSTTLVFFKQITITEEEDGEEVKKRIPLLRHFNVFNREQIEDLPESKWEAPEPVEMPELVEGLVEEHGMDVRWNGRQASWNPATDIINLPRPEQFVDDGALVSTALHEMTHWTGPRLERDMDGRFGDESYAAEELVAEIGSAFGCAEMGVEGMLQHPEYIAHWIKVLKNDKKAVFTASARAREAWEMLRGGGES